MLQKLLPGFLETDPGCNVALQNISAKPLRNGRQILLAWLGRGIFAACLVALFAYFGDYAVLRYRTATQRSPFGTVLVHPYYAVPQKDHKTEFLFDEARQEQCVNSLFPHLGDLPCWYLEAHKDRRIDM